MDIEKVAAKAKAMLKTDPKPEARDAGSGSSPEIEKTKEEVKKEEVSKKSEDQIEKDLLEKPVEEQKKDKESPLPPKPEAEDKKSNVQKRIDELTAKIKDLESDRNSTKAERDTLKNELDEIRRQLSLTPQDKVKEKVKGELIGLRKKYLEEDKNLPKEERREMSREELDDWAVEDYEAAQEWIAKRTLRRTEEERNIWDREEKTTKAKEILDKQHRSAEKTYIKHPELDISKRTQELKTQGKSPEEVHKILCGENPKYKLCSEIFNENQVKFIIAENGPEMVVEEMEKRMSKKAPEKSSSEIEDLRKRMVDLEAENARLKGLDTDLSSTRGPSFLEKETDFEKKQAIIAKKLGLDPNKVKKRVALRAERGYDD